MANHFGARKLGPLPATLGMFAYALAGSVAVTLVQGQGPAAWKSVAATSGSGLFWLIVVGVSVSTICNQGLRAMAFTYVNQPSSTAPFYYFSVVFSAGFDWLLYGIIPAWHVVIGTALVLVGAVIMARRGRQ